MSGARRAAARTLLALVLAAGSTMAASAQEARIPLRSPILTLDQERLFTESRRGQALLDRLEAETAELSAENRRIEADLIGEERALTEQRPDLDPVAFQALAQAFDEKVVAIRREQDAKARNLTQRRETEQQAFYREVLPLLAEIVRERGAVAVLERGAVILSAEQVDITEAAIALIDARMPDTPEGSGAGDAADPGAAGQDGQQP